jgi:hypothetical protein
MPLNGYVLHVDIAPVKEIVSLRRRYANSLNQIAVRAKTLIRTKSRPRKQIMRTYGNVIKPRKSSKLWTATKFWYRAELLENTNFYRSILSLLPFVLMDV